jgi:hypothetical protein
MQPTLTIAPEERTSQQEPKKPPWVAPTLEEVGSSVRGHTAEGVLLGGDYHFLGGPKVEFWGSESRVLGVRKSSSGGRKVEFWGSESRVLGVGKSNSGGHISMISWKFGSRISGLVMRKLLLGMGLRGLG